VLQSLAMDFFELALDSSDNFDFFEKYLVIRLKKSGRLINVVNLLSALTTIVSLSLVLAQISSVSSAVFIMDEYCTNSSDSDPPRCVCKATMESGCYTISYNFLDKDTEHWDPKQNKTVNGEEAQNPCLANPSTGRVNNTCMFCLEFDKDERNLEVLDEEERRFKDPRWGVVLTILLWPMIGLEGLYALLFLIPHEQFRTRFLDSLAGRMMFIVVKSPEKYPTLARTGLRRFTPTFVQIWFDVLLMFVLLTIDQCASGTLIVVLVIKSLKVTKVLWFYAYTFSLLPKRGRPEDEHKKNAIAAEDDSILSVCTSWVVIMVCVVFPLSLLPVMISIDAARQNGLADEGTNTTLGGLWPLLATWCTLCYLSYGCIARCIQVRANSNPEASTSADIPMGAPLDASETAPHHQPPTAFDQFGTPEVTHLTVTGTEPYLGQPAAVLSPPHLSVTDVGQPYAQQQQW
jgi:hypothetical protein